jgi:flagellin FlaB
VFSYVVLGAGFFTTQKSQQVVHAGVTQAASNIVVKGEVYGIATSVNSNVAYVRFDIGLAAGGLPVDADKLMLVMSTDGAVETLVHNPVATTPYQENSVPAAGEWVITSINGATDGNHLLNPDEAFTIYVAPPSDQLLDARTTFNIELKPETGASLGIQRTVPAGIDLVNLLY